MISQHFTHTYLNPNINLTFAVGAWKISYYRNESPIPMAVCDLWCVFGNISIATLPVYI